VSTGEPVGSPASSTRTAGSDQSLGELVGRLSGDMSQLFRQEVALAKAETKEEAQRAGMGAGMFAAAGVLSFIALLLLSLAAARALSEVMDIGWAYLVVAVVWAVVAAALAVIGRSKLRQVNPKPERTAETLREIPDALRGR
jgi:uncharacterized membrane protein YqjE